MNDMKQLYDLMNRSEGKPSSPLNNEAILALVNSLSEEVQNIDEKFSAVLESMGSDVARMVVNVVAVINLLIKNNIITEEQFTIAVAEVAKQFQQAIVEKEDPKLDLDVEV